MPQHLRWKWKRNISKLVLSLFLKTSFTDRKQSEAEGILALLSDTEDSYHEDAGNLEVCSQVRILPSVVVTQYNRDF